MQIPGALQKDELAGHGRFLQEFCCRLDALEANEPPLGYVLRRGLRAMRVLADVDYLIGNGTRRAIDFRVDVIRSRGIADLTDDDTFTRPLKPAQHVECKIDAVIGRLRSVVDENGAVRYAVHRTSGE